LLKGTIDWAYLTSLADAHGVKVLLYWTLERLFPEFLPSPVRSQLSAHFYNNTRRNLVFTAELIKLLGLFKRGGITVLPFRGPALAVSFYGDLALREFGDLDVLVRRKDVFRAMDLLIASGYRPFFPLPANRQAVLPRGEHTFCSEKGKVFLDLHWPSRIDSFLAHGSNGVWHRLESVSIEGHAVLTLSQHDMFLWLCIHGAKHNWRRLGWICDLNEMVRANRRMDWDGIVAHAEVLGARRMLALGLLLTGELMGADLTKPLLELVHKEKGVKSLAMQVYSRLFTREKHRDLLIEDPIFYLQSLDRMPHKFRYLLHHLLTPTPWAWRVPFLPSPLFFLHYFLRPGQLVKTYGLKTLRRMCHGEHI
jgi:hypothetical protein